MITCRSLNDFWYVNNDLKIIYKIIHKIFSKFLMLVFNCKNIPKPAKWCISYKENVKNSVKVTIVSLKKLLFFQLSSFLVTKVMDIFCV